MANMGYCRFENTVRDLDDCVDHLEDYITSTREQKARINLIKLCIQVVNSITDAYLDEDEIVDNFLASLPKKDNSENYDDDD